MEARRRFDTRRTSTKPAFKPSLRYFRNIALSMRPAPSSSIAQRTFGSRACASAGADTDAFEAAVPRTVAETEKCKGSTGAGGGSQHGHLIGFMLRRRNPQKKGRISVEKRRHNPEKDRENHRANRLFAVTFAAKGGDDARNHSSGSRRPSSVKAW